MNTLVQEPFFLNHRDFYLNLDIFRSGLGTKGPGQMEFGLWEVTHNVALGDTGNFFQFNNSTSKKKTSSLWKRAVNATKKQK